MALSISDDFNRGDNASLGGSWHEYTEGGSGLEVLDNAFHCERQDAGTSSYGYGVYSTLLEGAEISIEFEAKIGDGATSCHFRAFARSPSGTDLTTTSYFIWFSTGAEAKLYRNGGYIHPCTGLALTSTYQNIRWTLANRTGTVEHNFYADDVLVDTYEDTNASRITADGYVGFQASVSNASAANTVDMDWFTGDGVVIRQSQIIKAKHRLHACQSYRTSHPFQHAEQPTPPPEVPGYMLGSRSVPGVRCLHKTHTELREPFHYYGKYGPHLRGLYCHYIEFADELRGLYRVANGTVDGYELYRGVDAAPDFTAAPWETFSALPHDTAALAADHIYYFTLRQRNEYDLQSQNAAEWTVDIDADGNARAPRPSAPEDTALEADADGTVNLTSNYYYNEDGDDQATQFLIYLTSNGDDPNPDLDTPTVVEMVTGDGVAGLDWLSDAYGNGTTVKVIVRTRRIDTGPVNMDSTNTNIVSTTVDTSFPGAPDGDIFFERRYKQQQGD